MSDHNQLDWRVYHCDRAQPVSDEECRRWLNHAPPWRTPGEPPSQLRKVKTLSQSGERRGRTYVSSSSVFSPDNMRDLYEESQINMSLILRRPLLIEGPAGIGKSALAYHIAWTLGLGEPLRWEINSRTTLEDGLYKYRAVDHLRDLQTIQEHEGVPDIGQFITLGPLGTALAPSVLPRVLIIDELDKASFDLPNDLLHVFEEASFKIPELATKATQSVLPFDWDYKEDDKVEVNNGYLKAYRHPVMVITSNNERPFSPAFLRRCVRLKLALPSKEHLTKIVQLQLGQDVSPEVVAQFCERDHKRDLTTDYVLQALFAERRYQVPADLIKLH